MMGAMLSVATRQPAIGGGIDLIGCDYRENRPY